MDCVGERLPARDLLTTAVHPEGRVRRPGTLEIVTGSV